MAIKRLTEVWKEIPGYEGLYEVSSFGRVRSLDRVVLSKLGVRRLFNGKLLKEISWENDYLVSLCIEGKVSQKRIAVIVLEAFVSARPKGYLACHRNDIKYDNALGNLYWGTHKDNIEDAIRNGGFDVEGHTKVLSDYRLKYGGANTGNRHSEESIRKISEGCILHHLNKRLRRDDKPKSNTGLPGSAA